jgi:hypothetical protein
VARPANAQCAIRRQQLGYDPLPDLVRECQDPKSSTLARIYALQTLMSYAYGKPRQSVLAGRVKREYVPPADVLLTLTPTLSD